jgi:type III pantothenate kinase
MNLAIDIGNTYIKAAVFEHGQLVETFKSRAAGVELAESVLALYPAITKSIISSTRGHAQHIADALRRHGSSVLILDSDVAVPIKNLYATPVTLGHDRLAAAVGAHAIYPESNVMIVDFGTAITIDFINSAGEFLGGNISPGAAARFRALHDYTASLPLSSLSDNEEQLIASSTIEAIDSGVVNGILFEIEGYITRMEAKYSGLKIIFTGGDGNFFAMKLKNAIFATYDLVVYGLNRILDYNAG